MSPPLVAVIMGRDVILVAGAVYLRFRSLGGQPASSAADFFRIGSAQQPTGLAHTRPADTYPASRQKAPDAAQDGSSAAAPAVPAGAKGSPDVPLGAQSPDQAGEHFSLQGGHGCAHGLCGCQPALFCPAHAVLDCRRFIAAHRPGEDVPSPHSGTGAQSPVAAPMRPLLVSKANTVLQILLIGGCLSAPALGWPSQEGVLLLGSLTAVTTVVSGLAYLRTPGLFRH